jgi:V8-like Glu-specific endopeptidase
MRENGDLSSRTKLIWAGQSVRKHRVAVLIVSSGGSIMKTHHWRMRMINRALALLILALGLIGPAAAAELDDAVAAAQRGEYAAALRRLSPLAEKGDARAQFDVGFMHAYGWGVPRNPAEAITWYRKAADQGLPVAQHFLGLAYANGEGVRPDDPEAARWFARAAAQGFAQAQFLLGLMTLDGRGVPKDIVQGYAFSVMAGQGGVRSAARTVQKLALTEAQRGQAQEIIDHWKPRPESSLAGFANPRAEELLGLDRHIGEVVDPSSWPASAIGVVAVAHFSTGGWCTGTLVAPRIVLTAAHCLLNGTEPINPGNVHFLAGMNKGTPASSSAAERFIVAKDFAPTLRDKWTLDRSPADWALIVLKDPMSSRPVAVKALTREELRAATLAGIISEIGYGEERRYSPTALRNCRADLGKDNRLLIVQCLANFGYSGSPILADINGTPAVVGIFSAFQEETRLMFAAAASQFEAAIRDLIGAEAGPSR